MFAPSLLLDGTPPQSVLKIDDGATIAVSNDIVSLAGKNASLSLSLTVVAMSRKAILPAVLLLSSYTYC